MLAAVPTPAIQGKKRKGKGGKERLLEIQMGSVRLPSLVCGVEAIQFQIQKNVKAVSLWPKFRGCFLCKGGKSFEDFVVDSVFQNIVRFNVGSLHGSSAR